MAQDDIVIEWTTADQAEHSESWVSIDAFLSWAASEGIRGQYRVYQEDEDGDLLLTVHGTF